jgi:sulfur carrier protein
MNLVVNGENLKIDECSNVQDLITKLGYQDQRIALEVNESIIPKSKHSEFSLNEGDKIEVIKAVGGG